MTQSRLQSSPATAPAAISALRLLAIVSVHGVHDETRRRARRLFARYAAPTIRLVIVEYYGPRAGHGAFEQLVDRALDRIVNDGGLEVGSASDAALWQVIQAAVWPEAEPVAARVRLRAPLGTGVLHHLEADEVIALLKLFRPLLSSEDLAALWIAACGPAQPSLVADDRAHGRFEHTLLQWVVERPVLRGYPDRVAPLAA